jgi:hypothetical protein
MKKPGKPGFLLSGSGLLCFCVVTTQSISPQHHTSPNHPTEQNRQHQGNRFFGLSRRIGNVGFIT